MELLTFWPLIQVPKGLQRLQGKTFKDKEGKNIKEKKQNTLLPQPSLHLSPHPQKYSKNRNIKNTSPVLSSFSALCLESLVSFSVGPSCWLWLYLPSVPDPEKPKPVSLFLLFWVNQTNNKITIRNFAEI